MEWSARAPILVEAFERVAAQGPRKTEREGNATKLLRVGMAPLAWAMRAANRLEGVQRVKVNHHLRRREPQVRLREYATVKRAARLAYSRVLKKPSRRAIKAVRLMLRGEETR
jgi:hypothetical protein